MPSEPLRRLTEHPEFSGSLWRKMVRACTGVRAPWSCDWVWQFSQPRILLRMAGGEVLECNVAGGVLRMIPSLRPALGSCWPLRIESAFAFCRGPLSVSPVIARMPVDRRQWEVLPEAQTCGAPPSRPIASAVAVGEGGRIYAFGGFADSPPRIITRFAQIYEKATGTWHRLAEMPRSSFQASAVWAPRKGGGRIFVVGGQTDLGAPPAASVLEYRPATDSWTEPCLLPPALQPVRIHRDWTVDLLGMLAVYTKSGQVFVWDPLLELWFQGSWPAAAVDVLVG